MPEQNRGQTEVFEVALESLAHELDQEMFSWDFSRMMEELKKSILDHFPHDGNRIRAFARRYLGMSGDRFKILKDWIHGQEMSQDEICLVLRTLNELSDTVDVSQKQPAKPVQERSVFRNESSVTQRSSGVVRKLIDHVISIFNSIVGLIVEARVNENDVFDGDRMQLISALQRICDCFGIAVVFSEKNSNRNQPLTRSDMAELDFPKSTKKRGIK